jgi:hypothetical protein
LVTMICTRTIGEARCFFASHSSSARKIMIYPTLGEWEVIADTTPKICRSRLRSIPPPPSKNLSNHRRWSAITIRHGRSSR